MLKLKRKYKAPLLSIFGACSILGSSTAFGTVTCLPGVEIMDIHVSGETVTISRESNDPGSPILVNGLTCLNINNVPFTVNNTPYIEVHAGDLPDINEGVVIDLVNGQFTPGTPTESSGRSEIEFNIDLGLGDNTVTVLGRAGTDTFDIGTANTDGNTGPNQNYDIATDSTDLFPVFVGNILINTNASLQTSPNTIDDNDADIHIASPANTQLVVKGRDGADFLDGRALSGTGVGDRAQVPLQLHGGPGADTIDGGPLDDSIFGNKGDDDLNGRGGDDLVKGGPGADKVFGGSGDDILFGQKGNDRLNGGAGFDECNVGTPGISSGDSAAVSCETVN